MGAGELIIIPFRGAGDFITTSFGGVGSPLREPSSSFSLGRQREKWARTVYHQGPSAKSPLAFFPPVR